MLIWINGPFGGGKTQTAHELRHRLPGAVVCDPEEPGFGLHRMTPRGMRGDFQDFAAWRLGVFEVLDLVLRRHEGPVLAPMTLVRPDYFAETVGRLRERGHAVHHFALLASRETVLRRLRTRGLGRLAQFATGGDRVPRWETFAVRHLDECLDRLRDPLFAEQLDTEERTVGQVAEHIAAAAGLTLAPVTGGPVRTELRRLAVSVRHVRLF